MLVPYCDPCSGLRCKAFERESLITYFLRPEPFKKAPLLPCLVFALHYQTPEEFPEDDWLSGFRVGVSVDKKDFLRASRDEKGRREFLVDSAN